MISTTKGGDAGKKMMMIILRMKEKPTKINVKGVEENE